MKKIINTTLIISCIALLTSCWTFYSFTGGNTGDAKTIQIDFFRNEAPLVEPTLSQRFTQDLQELFTRQTNLSLTKTNGDLQFEGEITDYRIVPTSSSANQKAALNRLKITVNVRFTNKLKKKDDFERQFSFYADFGANENAQGAVLENLLDIIFERITQDIFNASVAKW